MYLMIHESRNSNRKFLIRYDPDHNAVQEGKFTIEDEHHRVYPVTEKWLFDAIDYAIEAIE